LLRVGLIDEDVSVGGKISAAHPAPFAPAVYGLVSRVIFVSTIFFLA
jgi:hypothetical protein